MKQLKLDLDKDPNQKELVFNSTLSTGEVTKKLQQEEKKSKHFQKKGFLPNHHAIHHQV